MIGKDNTKVILRKKGYEYFNSQRTLSGLKHYLEEILSLINCGKQNDELPTLEVFLLEHSDYVNIPPHIFSCTGLNCNTSNKCDSSLICCILMAVFAVYTFICYSTSKISKAKLEDNKISVPSSVGLGIASTATAVTLSMITMGYIASSFQEDLQLSDGDNRMMKAFIGLNAIFFGAASISYFGLGGYKVYVRNKINSIVDELMIKQKCSINYQEDAYQPSTSSSIPLLNNEEISNSFLNTEEVIICTQAHKNYDTI